MEWDISWTDLTPDKSTPENTMFQSEISRAYHGKGKATIFRQRQQGNNIQTAPARQQYSDSAGSRLDRQPIQWYNTEIPEYLCAPQVKKDEVPVPERSNEQSRLMGLWGY